MTLQSSGQISMGDMNTEMVRSGQFSHNTVINATGNSADTVNRFEKNTSYPNTTTSYNHSEWYSYKHFPRNGLQAFYSANHSASTDMTTRTQYVYDLSGNGNTCTNTNGNNHILNDNNYGGILRDSYKGWSARSGNNCLSTTSTINSGQSNVTYAFAFISYWYGYCAPYGFWNGSAPYSLFWVPADTMQNNNPGLVYAMVSNTTYGSGVNLPTNSGYGSELNRYLTGSQLMVYFVTSNGTTSNYYYCDSSGDSYTYASSRGSNTHSLGTTGNQCNRVLGRNTGDTDSGPMVMSEFAAWNRILTADDMKRVATYWYSYMPDSMRHNKTLVTIPGNSPGYYTSGTNYSWDQIFTPKKLSDVSNGYNARWQCGGGYPGTWVMYCNSVLQFRRPYMIKWYCWNGNNSNMSRCGYDIGGWTSFGTVTNYSSGNYHWATVVRNTGGDTANNQTWDWSGAWNTGFAEIEGYSY